MIYRIILLFFCLVGMATAEMKLEREIIVETIDLSAMKQFSCEILSKESRRIGEYKAIDVLSLFEEYAHLPADKVYISFLSDNGSKSFLMNEFVDGVAVIPPVFLICNHSYRRGDSLVFSESKGDRLSINKKLDESFFLTDKRIIKLQISNKANNLGKAISGFSLLFPTDMTEKRWMKNIKKIQIYTIQNNKD